RPVPEYAPRRPADTAGHEEARQYIGGAGTRQRRRATIHSRTPTTGESGGTGVGSRDRGRLTVKTVPRPGRLCTVMEPPCASAIHLVIARPNPAPGRAPVRVRAVSTR